MCQSKIIKKRQRVREVRHVLFFSRVGSHGHSGFSYDCDENGVVNIAKLAPEGVRSLRDCKAGVGTSFEAPVVETREHTWTDPAVLECGCGQHVSLDDAMDNICKCGKIYNMSGQEMVAASWDCDEQGEPLSWRDDN